jgi:hypothetical protein
MIESPPSDQIDMDSIEPDLERIHEELVDEENSKKSMITSQATKIERQAEQRGLGLPELV